ncbi:MAG: MerR family transcriptional regulator [Desulfobacterales bacterium]|nr:MAG: MerR family transcriptional regulator [Desulfobacterales bacterium]
MDIPDKLYFRIGEVSEIVKLPSYVLRFWETEFPKIKPKRTSSGRRLYTQKDIELIMQIKYLLHEKKFTIPGARQHIGGRSGKKGRLTQRFLDDLRKELKSIRDLLD